MKDEQNVFELDSDPEVMRFLTSGRPSSMENIRQALTKTQNLYQKHSGRFGFWAAIEKNTDKFMGWFHFRPSKNDPDNVKRIELGYRLKKEFWGKNFATEGSLALIKKGFEELGVEEVFAATMKKNLASQKVMEKAGLTFSREYLDPRFPESKELDVEFSLLKENWTVSK
jgi:RimJ/RimL family protein N-acetyltransferase